MITSFSFLSCRGQPKPRFHIEAWLHVTKLFKNAQKANDAILDTPIFENFPGDDCIRTPQKPARRSSCAPPNNFNPAMAL